MQSEVMHELGHALSIGWLHDKGDGHIAECYSGSDCVKGSIAGVKLVGGGEDETPEDVVIPNEGLEQDWSIMTNGFTAEMFNRRLVYSLEELFTLDTEDIPSKAD